MFNADKIYEDTLKDLEKEKKKRAAPAQVRLWDGDWNLFAEIIERYEVRFKFEHMDTGNATVVVPLSSQVGQAMMDPDTWPTKSMYVTIDKDGARWSGRLEGSITRVNYTGEQEVEMTFAHDYQKLKELLVWSNPFLLAEIQFPKAWLLFGPARWVVATTLFVNLHRKGTSRWMLPDDPMDIGQWFDLDMSNWSMVVKPVDFFRDTSLTAVVTSRFKYFHDCVKDICLDSQLSIECRRYLPGDPDPIPGKNLRYGCLVFEVVDKSGWNKETSFFGSTLDGLVRQIMRMSDDDGLVETVETLPRVDYPAEYYQNGFLGSMPEAPWVVLEHGPLTGMESSEYEYIPPGPSQFVTGGSSMPGVNEVIKASVVGLGGFLGSIIGQSQIGTVADALLEPLYSDVFMAFKAEKMRDRIAEQGWDYPFEKWVDGADKAYTLSSLAAMRKAKVETRARRSANVKMINGAPYWVGDRGHGDFFIGDRVAIHALGMPKDQLFVEQVESLEYEEDIDGNNWEIGIGKPEFASGLSYIGQQLDNTKAGLKELGVW